MNDIRHIVFDIGKVLLHYDPELAYVDLIPDAAERRWFLSNVTSNVWNVEQDRGRNWAEAEQLLIESHAEHEHLIRTFRKNWRSMVPYAYDDSVALLEHLIDDDHDVTLLTNFAADTYLEAEIIYPFLQRARGVTVSGQHGLIKPDAAIFDLHARRFGLNGHHTLLIDDSAANVAGARLFGWHAVQFTDAEALKRDLNSFGIAA